MERKGITKSLAEEKKCIICQKSFLRRIKAKSRALNMISVQKSGSLTCSRKCARIYTKVFDKTTGIYRVRISNLNKEIRKLKKR